MMENNTYVTIIDIEVTMIIVFTTYSLYKVKKTSNAAQFHQLRPKLLMEQISKNSDVK